MWLFMDIVFKVYVRIVAFSDAEFTVSLKGVNSCQDAAFTVRESYKRGSNLGT
jgi:hypothetical protein